MVCWVQSGRSVNLTVHLYQMPVSVLLLSLSNKDKTNFVLVHVMNACNGVEV
jgi:hypothetical protein